MKICYLSSVNSPHTVKWCEFFSKNGHEVHLISFDKGEIENVNVHHIDVNANSQSNRLLKLAFLFSYREVRNLIHEIDPDIIHAHRATGYAFVAYLSKFHPYILSVWGNDVYDLPKQFIFKKFVQFNLKKADYVFSTSKAMKRQVGTLVNKDIVVTPFGVDIDFFKPINETKLNNKFVIGTVKTLNPNYGIEYLIKAFKIVKDRNPNVNFELQIAGKGEQESELMNLCEELKIQNDVIFLGYLFKEKVVEAFNNFNIAVFPSISESFGVAAVEAQSCGLPVIVTNVGGFPEATKPGFSSILVESKDVNGLADAIELLYKDSKLRNDMAINARKFIEQKYDIYKNFGKVEELYEAIVQGKKIEGDNIND